MTITETAGPDPTQVKERQQQMWASGDFHAVAVLIQPVAEHSWARTCRPRRGLVASISTAPDAEGTSLPPLRRAPACPTCARRPCPRLPPR